MLSPLSVSGSPLCLWLLLLLVMALHTSLALPRKDLAPSILQDYAEPGVAGDNVLELLLRAALHRELPSAGVEEDAGTAAADTDWGIDRSWTASVPRSEVKRGFPPGYVASRGKRPLLPHTYVASRGKRQPTPGMFFGSRGRRLWQLDQMVKRMSPNVFHGSRGKRYYDFQDDDDDDVRMLSDLGRRLSLQRSFGYRPDMGLHMDDKRQPPFGFHGSRG